MKNKITGGRVYPHLQPFRFLNLLYRVIQTKLLQEPVFAHCGVKGGAKNYDDIFSSDLLLYREIGGSRKKGSFYGQADCKGGGAPSALTTQI